LGVSTDFFFLSFPIFGVLQIKIPIFTVAGLEVARMEINLNFRQIRRIQLS
jgi:hypothetical protein